MHTTTYTYYNNYRKLILISAIACISIFCSLLFVNAAKAAPVVGFNAGNIIDDQVFTNKDSMNVGQIQNFLNSKVSACDTGGTQPASEYGRPDISRSQYAASRGWAAPPYTCLKDYSVNGVSAAQLIYNAAQKYTINPQTFIVLLQKEQGLVTDTWPLSSQYVTAAGYACPDNAPCDSQYYGLVNQLEWSGKMFRAIMDNVPQDRWYTPYILGNNTIYYNPGPYNNATQSYYGRFGTKRDVEYCGGTTVNILNRATQALYNYTPYQPNPASIDAGYGTAGICGAYGNRNFYLYFTDWFGSVRSDGSVSGQPLAQVQRLYNTKTYEHYYSTDRNEIDNLVKSGWQLVGPAFNVTTNSAVAVPVYRLYNARVGLHFWTTSLAESASIQQNLGYIYEGVAFYTVNPSVVSQYPIYRLYNPRTGVHFWTLTPAEASAAIQNAGFRMEGPALYSQ